MKKYNTVFKESIFSFDQTHLIQAYKDYCDYLTDIDKSTVVGFSGYVGRTNKLSGKIKNEFHLKGKYYIYYGNKKENTHKLDEYFFIEDKRICVFNCLTYNPKIHYHFSVIAQEYIHLKLVENILYYKNKVIDKKILEEINTSVTKVFKTHYDGVLENYGNSNNFILL